ncbi:hypothetical protein ACMYZ5_09690, partial [Bacteroides sp. KG68]|uniref:hypothetical protein n=1 Tax=Bacteroides sp. KG68 TaxID=3397824 RepID=UPI003D990C8C
KKNEGFEKKKLQESSSCSFSFTQFCGQCRLNRLAFSRTYITEPPDDCHMALVSHENEERANTIGSSISVPTRFAFDG